MTSEVEKLRRQVKRLQVENAKMRMALTVVAAGIWRDTEKNACGLAGAALTVQAVEDALGIERPKRRKSR